MLLRGCERLLRLRGSCVRTQTGPRVGPPGLAMYVPPRTTSPRQDVWATHPQGPPWAWHAADRPRMPALRPAKSTQGRAGRDGFAKADLNASLCASNPFLHPLWLTRMSLLPGQVLGGPPQPLASQRRSRGQGRPVSHPGSGLRVSCLPPRCMKTARWGPWLPFSGRNTPKFLLLL